MRYYLAALILVIVWSWVLAGWLQGWQERRRANRMAAAERAARKRSWDDTY